MPPRERRFIDDVPYAAVPVVDISEGETCYWLTPSGGVAKQGAGQSHRAKIFVAIIGPDDAAWDHPDIMEVALLDQIDLRPDDTVQFREVRHGNGVGMAAVVEHAPRVIGPPAWARVMDDYLGD